MDRLAQGIIKHKKIIVVLFLVTAVLCAFGYTLVSVNYNLTDYLPEKARSTQALRLMEAEFEGAVPNAKVMVQNVTPAQALTYKEKLKAIEGVSSVLWLDDIADLTVPLETMEADLVSAYYRDGAALFSLTLEQESQASACASIRALIGEQGALAGDAVDAVAMQQATSGEVMNAMLIAIPLILLLLILSTRSWLEPVLFLAAIGVSVLINMGTHLLMGEISFMTHSVTPILQLAVSLDYAIFLLHRFEQNRAVTGDPAQAMQDAIKASIRSISASALTTLFGFIALLFMDFKIGADLGLSLAKGIVFSFLCVVVFLPALTLCLVKALDRTRHRPLLPSFSGVGKALHRFSLPAVLLAAVLLLPCFLGQSKTDFLYGSASKDESSQSLSDARLIENTFGRTTDMVLLVPRGQVDQEKALGEALLSLSHVTGVQSYARTVGSAIPPAYVGEEVTDQFYSAHYARFILTLDTEPEGTQAFETVEAVQQTAARFYGDDFYTAGQSANLYDMQEVVRADNTRVNLLAMLAILAVLIFCFKSAALPPVLLLTIETAIWINMAVPYFTGASINYIGYLVVSTVQLGATVDYAILLTDHYMNHRRSLGKNEAADSAVGAAFKSVLVSSLTLSLAGFALYFTSSDARVSDIGLLLGRGTLISFALVVFVLPALLRYLDKGIEKLTLKPRFCAGRERREK